MYKQNKMHNTSINRNTSTVGESIEEKVERITNNKGPITDAVELIYTERSEGVLPAYDIRTDRFEIAIDAMTAIQKTKIAEREKRITDKLGKKAKDGMDIESKTESKNEGGAQPTAGTDSK